MRQTHWEMQVRSQHSSGDSICDTDSFCFQIGGQHTWVDGESEGVSLYTELKRWQMKGHINYSANRAGEKLRDTARSQHALGPGLNLQHFKNTPPP